VVGKPINIQLNRINSFLEDELLRLFDHSEKRNFCKLIHERAIAILNDLEESEEKTWYVL
jgi:hypothetical protein